METTVKEIAAQLRSTEEMATQFVQRIQNRVDQSVSEDEILAVMQKIATRSLSMEKVIAKLQQQRKMAIRRTQKREAANRRTQKRKAARRSSRRVVKPQKSPDNPETAPAATTLPKEPKTTMERLGVVLQKNWDRAEAEDLLTNRMSTEAFVNAVYQYTDRREGTRQRILQAAKQLNQSDVILAPALVADVVHKLFEG